MKDFSNKYIFTFSAVMVVSVAILLSLTALLLQPRQDKECRGGEEDEYPLLD